MPPARQYIYYSTTMHLSSGTSLDDCCLLMQANGKISIHYALPPTNGRHKQMLTCVDVPVHCSVHLTTIHQFQLRSSNLQSKTWGMYETAINSTLRTQFCHDNFFILWLFFFTNIVNQLLCTNSLDEFRIYVTKSILSMQVTIFYPHGSNCYRIVWKVFVFEGYCRMAKCEGVFLRLVFLHI
jgi:hypothetical protein